MDMIPVSSSIIDSIGYDDASGTLMVVFRDGYVYEFHLVPRRIFDDFLQARSKGSFFNEQLKSGRYGARRTRRS